MRRRFPALRTLPSSTVLASNFRPTSLRSSALPLNAKEDVLDTTLSSSIFVRSLRISSDIPSQKNSCSSSVLIFANGSTAIDGLSVTSETSIVLTLFKSLITVLTS